jgi:hypothetical protein
MEWKIALGRRIKNLEGRVAAISAKLYLLPHTVI